MADGGNTYRHSFQPEHGPHLLASPPEAELAPERRGRSHGSADYFEYQRRVSAVAYQLWLKEGRPADRGVEHWNRAEELIAAANDTAGWRLAAAV
jgi:hypothetical protein